MNGSQETSDPATTNPARSSHGVPLGQALRVWCRVALLSFGGPAGQIAVMHRIIVEEKRWISESRFLHALNYCMLLPGPEAQQLATYIGWLMHRTWGGIIAGTLFILPGFLAILALSILYAGYRDWTFVDGLFFGLTPAVMALVIEAVMRIGKRVIKNSWMLAIAAASFIAIFFLQVPFPAIILAAGLIGLIGGRVRPDKFIVVKMHGGKGGDNEPAASVALPDDFQPHAPPTWGRAVRVAALCLTLWFGPLVAIAMWMGPDHLLMDMGLFFSKAAVVTFGGAYAVLAYIAQQAVEVYGWLEPGEMLYGLGMAETTPGPLIMVVQFVGFMGAWRAGEAGAVGAAGGMSAMGPMGWGVIASMLVTWVTFVPCFMWIFLGAPFVEQLRGNRLLTAALSTITAAVVGVVLNLSVWFTLHALFGQLAERHWYGIRLLIPDLASVNVAVLILSAAAMLALLRFKLGLFWTLGGCVAAGLTLRLLNLA